MSHETKVNLMVDAITYYKPVSSVSYFLGVRCTSALSIRCQLRLDSVSRIR